jgi:Na+-driven multidrug efflux pump
MGIAGAAVGTVLAQLGSFSWVLYCFLMHKVPLKLRINYIWPHYKTILEIISLGVSPFALQLGISLVQFVINNQLQNFGGDTAIAAMGVTTSISQMLMMPVFGINQGVQPIIGFNYGARLFNRVKRLLLQAILLATVVISTLWLIAMLFTNQIVSLFGAHNVQLMKEAPIAVRLFLMALPFVGFQVVSANYFLAVGKSRHAIVLSLSRQVLFLIPAALIMPMFFKINGVYASGAVADLAATITTAAFLIYEIRHLNRIHAESSQEIISG